ncbi:myosin-binding protein 7-like isoform X2 [Rhodamnia argentea]|uniref:Myosin-binding protein 7-like isoform X2 n=1 Tax=Rhodamnia argentea TaxID=178133 RepID=A0A8B8PAE6_9MYRT|nr:myosin-binding protein 7-like isoform X2 [Rhodamnia argentea]
MDSVETLPSRDSDCCHGSSDGRFSAGSAWFRNVKRKYDELQCNRRFLVPGVEYDSVARIEIENEIVALREMVSSQQKAIQDLTIELEEERNAASSAASEAMSMILRLQRDKAEIQMDARQFKLFAEERMGHDQQEILALEDLLYKREQAIQSLTCQVQAYRHRMMSYGLTVAEADGEHSLQHADSQGMTENFDFPSYEYPPLKCHFNETSGPWEGENEVIDVEKFAHGETPQGRNELKDLEFRIHQMEQDPSNNQMDGDFPGLENIPEKVIVGQSPRQPRHSRRSSNDGLGTLNGTSRDTHSDLPLASPRLTNSFQKMECVSETENFYQAKKLNNTPEADDDITDRICTIDSIYTGLTPTKSAHGSLPEDIVTPRYTSNCINEDQDPDITKLYMRLQALEADRESLRQAIVSMQTDKAQMLLLKEIAERLCKQKSPEECMPVRKPARFGFFFSVFKWIGSFPFWRKKTCRSKYLFGLSPDCVGLLILLQDRPQMKQWRCLTRSKRVASTFKLPYP